jgi:zinc and cadmium transporter
MNPWVLSLASVGGVSLVSLIGLATLPRGESGDRPWIGVLLSGAVGALLGDAFIHLIPASFAGHPGSLAPSLLMLGGMLLFFVVEKLLRHQHGPLHQRHHPAPAGRPELAAINIVGDAIHNFIDGVLIAASYLASPTLGVATTVAVLCHEIPQELGDFGILLHSGFSRRQAVLVNLATASAAVVGAAVALVVGTAAEQVVTTVLIPVAAGGFVYIAAADLVPELQHDRTLRGLVVQVAGIALGMGAMGLLTLLE